MHSNEQIIRALYPMADGASKDTAKFVSQFSDDGYLLDVSSGTKYRGAQLGTVVDVFASAFPDMHRELFDVYATGDVVVVELALRGTHRGELPHSGHTIAPTGRKIDVPCCDVFHLKEGKITSFHCYIAASVLMQQLGVN
jgi:predicted ester cyclase